jgi:hypothetical protein
MDRNESVTWSNFIPVIGLVCGLTVGCFFLNRNSQANNKQDCDSKVEILSSRLKNISAQNCRIGLALTYMARDLKIIIPENSIPICPDSN